jgi:hypothetical protein
MRAGNSLNRMRIRVKGVRMRVDLVSRMSWIVSNDRRWVGVYSVGQKEADRDRGRTFRERL